MMKSRLLMGIWSVVIAFGLWIYVITAVSPGSEMTIEEIPVSLQGQTSLNEKDWMVVKILDTTVDVRLAGNRSDLVKLDKNNITVTANVGDIDVTTIDENGIASFLFTVRIPNDTATVVGSSPARVRVQLEERVARDIPVVVDYGDTQTPDGFEEEVASLEYLTIPVLGPKSVVDNIDCARLSVDLTDKKQTIEQTLEPVFVNTDGSLTNTELLKWEISQVDVRIPIKCVKDIPVLLNVFYGNGANADNTVIELEYDTIRVAGSEGLLADLESVTLIDTIDLTQIMEDTTITSSFVLPPEVTVKQPANSNKEVVVSVSFTDVASAFVEVDTSKIEFMNLPEGLTAEMATENVRVMVRGTKSLVEQLTAEDILLKVDLAGVKVGEKSYELKVELAQEYADLAVLDSVTARIIIAQETEN